MLLGCGCNCEDGSVPSDLLSGSVQSFSFASSVGPPVLPVGPCSSCASSVAPLSWEMEWNYPGVINPLSSRPGWFPCCSAFTQAKFTLRAQTPIPLCNDQCRWFSTTRGVRRVVGGNDPENPYVCERLPDSPMMALFINGPSTPIGCYPGGVVSPVVLKVFYWSADGSSAAALGWVANYVYGGGPTPINCLQSHTLTKYSGWVNEGGAGRETPCGYHPFFDQNLPSTVTIRPLA